MEVRVYIDAEGHLQFVVDEKDADSSWRYLCTALWGVKLMDPPHPEGSGLRITQSHPAIPEGSGTV